MGQEGVDAMNTARRVQNEERTESRLYEQFEEKIRSVGLGIENMQQQKDIGDSMEAQVSKDVAQAEINAKAAMERGKSIANGVEQMHQLMENATQYAQITQAQASMAEQHAREAKEAGSTLSQETADAENTAL